MMRFAAFLGLVLAGPVPAQAPARSFAETAAPFIDEHTLVVVRVDVSRADVDSALKLAVPLIGDGDEAGEIVKGIRGWVADFVRLGGRDVFLTYGAADFANLPCLVTPAPADAVARKALGEKLAAVVAALGKPAEWAEAHGCVCAGTKDALTVVKARKPVDRPDLAAAVEAGKDGVAQVAFAPSAEARKIHEQVAPTLPAELGGGSIHKITRGLRWMTLSIGPGPKMPARLVTEATSPEAAQDLKGLEALAQQAALTRLLKGEGETDAAFGRRVRELLSGHRTAVDGSRLTTEWELATTLLEAVKLPEGPPADRARSANNLKQLMLALHNYHDNTGRFPADVRDKDGKPLLSWRVQILPYIDEAALYKQFKLDEPWDSPNNKSLAARMPKLLRSPRQAAALKDQTTYLAPLGTGFFWDDPKGIKITEVADGTSNTIALVEADDDRAAVWTKPEDISIDPKVPESGLLGHYTDGFQAAMADGSVRFFRKGIDPKQLWALFTRAGGEVIDIPK